jgi:hypothetical protein
MYFISLLAATIIYAGNRLYQDQQIRDAEYTKPLSTMPDNAWALFLQMLSAETTGKTLSAKDVAALKLEILAILSAGAVAQRNHEMAAVRKKISHLGYFLSWLLKQKGLSYEQIYKKYQLTYGADEQQLHMEIIKSASRANPSVLNKLIDKLSHVLTFSKPAEDSKPSGGPILAKL